MKSPVFLKLSAIVIVFSILLSACRSAAPTAHGTPTEPQRIPPTHVPAANIAQSEVKRVTLPNVPADDIHTLTEANNAFALDLYQSLRAQNGNLVYSPYSISLALAMTYAGARGETESQMAKTMHFLSQDKLHPALNILDLELAQRGKAQSKDQTPLQLNIANAVWAEQTFPFLKSYLDLIAQNYGAGVQLADFINQSDAVRKEINGWVSKKTNDKIQDLIPAGVLDAATRMVLVNAIYFKADWVYPFDPDDTRDAPFHLLDGSDVQVKMMSQGLRGVPYTQGDGYQAVELPYQGQSAVMDIIVPDEGKFNGFESTFDVQKLNKILGDLQPSGGLELGLPKFSFSADFSLKDHLIAMGMPDAFDDRADFSGMTGKKDLCIAAVLHKAFVAVDEKGTEAAAATAVVMRETAAMLPEASLIVDRPFLFVIRDLPSGQILFIGRVLNPVE